MAADERPSDLVYVETAQDVEYERNLGFLGKAGMAARKHHPKLVVFDRVRLELLLDSRRERPFTLEQPPQLGGEGAGGAFAAQDIEGAVLRRGHKPGGRVFRHTPEFPHFQRAAKASCTTSSASARLWTPKMRVSVATIRLASRRKRCSSISITCLAS